MSVSHKVMNRHQFDRRNAEVSKVVNRHRMPKTSICAPQWPGYFRVKLGKALDVKFVDNGLVQGDLEESIFSPVKIFIDYNAFRYGFGVVALVLAKIRFRVTYLIREQGIIPCYRAVDSFSVRVKQHFCGIKA